MTISHTQRHIAHTSGGELFLCRQAAGALELEQDGREVALEPGDLTLIDPSLPYAGRFHAGSRLLVLKIPRRPLEARIGQTREMTARSIKPCEAEHGLTSAFVEMLPSYAGRLGAAAAALMAEHVLDLVAISLAKAMEGARPRISSARSMAMLRVRAAIEARLNDAALTPSAVAAAAGLSLRYANAVLAEANMSVRRLIQARRLAYCRKALEDPSQAHRTVSEIAYSWGFSDMTHFGRRFKAAYGLLPNACRRLATAPH
jgi:AraC-like DNA-binding protein